MPSMSSATLLCQAGRRLRFDADPHNAVLPSTAFAIPPTARRRFLRRCTLDADPRDVLLPSPSTLLMSRRQCPATAGTFRSPPSMTMLLSHY